MSLLCRFKGHRWRHKSNWDDVTGGRALYQCHRCKEITMDTPPRYGDKRNHVISGVHLEYRLGR